MKKTVLLFFIILSTLAYTQAIDSFFTTSDNEFSFGVQRINNTVKIFLKILNSKNYDYLIVEKSNNQISGFAQCQYISLAKTKVDSLAIVRKDLYPLNASEDAYYRIRAVTREGVIRAYPSVRLKGLHNVAEKED